MYENFDSIKFHSDSSPESQTVLTFAHVSPWHALHAGPQFSPAFLQEHRPPQTFLHEHLMIFIRNSGAGSKSVITGT